MEDSSPERRNLVVTSLAFIVYVIAGGHFASEVQLHVINVKFDNRVTLIVVAWSMLAWFWYRYWMKHKGKFLAGLTEELLHSQSDAKLMSKLTKQLVINSNGAATDVNIQIVSVTSLFPKLLFGIRVEFRKDGTQVKTEHFSDYTISGFDGYMTGFRLLALKCIKEPSFSDYGVPYLLAFCAVVCGAYRLICG